MSKQIRKATAEQRQAYEGLYPLYGYVAISGHECPIEHLDEGRDEPNYELRSPAPGYSFEDGLHGKLETTLSDLRETIRFTEVVKCAKGCDCGESFEDREQTT